MKIPRILAVAALAALSPLPAAEPSQHKPNILLLLVDDMGWADFSCFGDTEAKTPAIDAVAAEGIRFHQFYVNSPICSPSRCALLTGQYPQRWRINSYLASRAENARRGMADWLDPKAPSLARILHDAGYATGHFGKWHLGGQRDVGDAPLITEYGFDQSLTSFEGLGPRILQTTDAWDGKPAKPYTLGSDKLGRGPIQWEDRSKITGRWTAAALDFIRKAQREGRPFYVDLWPDDVHSPFFPPRALRTSEAKRRLYLAVLQAMDAQLAPILEFIRRDPKLRDNTIILICSDNGPEPGAGSAAPFRGKKGQLYEGGVRSPLIVWGPGFVNPKKAGSINDASVLAAIDLAPSLLALAGIAAPKGVAFDGEPLSDTLRGNSAASRAAPLFFRRPPDRGSTNDGRDLPDLAVRDGKWKLLCEYDGSRPQLYDLQADPAEGRNVASVQPDKVKELSTKVVDWNAGLPRAIDDKLP